MDIVSKQEGCRNIEDKYNEVSLWLPHGSFHNLMGDCDKSRDLDNIDVLSGFTEEDVVEKNKLTLLDMLSLIENKFYKRVSHIMNGYKIDFPSIFIRDYNCYSEKRIKDVIWSYFGYGCIRKINIRKKSKNGKNYQLVFIHFYSFYPMYVETKQRYFVVESAVKINKGIDFTFIDNDKFFALAKKYKTQ